MGKSWDGWAWLLAAVITVAISNGAVLFLLIKMPARYFSDPASRDSAGTGRHVVLRWTILVGKNLLGVVLILLGILLSLPGVPGPGLLLALLGLTLLNFPGKRRLERRLIAAPGVGRTINRLRARFGQPPLVLDAEPIGPGAASEHPGTPRPSSGAPAPSPEGGPVE